MLPYRIGIAHAQAGAPVETLITFDPTTGELPEGVTVDNCGNVYVGIVSTGELRKLSTTGEQLTLATLDTGRGPEAGYGLVGLAVDPAGNVYAALASFVEATHGVWRVRPDGASERLAVLPVTTVPNALAFDRRGNLFVSDSLGGKIYRVARGARLAEVWSSDPRLVGDLSLGLEAVGANGVAFYSGALFVANSDAARIYRIPVAPDGSAGRPVLHFDGIQVPRHRLRRAGEPVCRHRPRQYSDQGRCRRHRAGLGLGGGWP
ncbi:SMP-30/gluconolactonase/LRE family protein [Gloeobacter morelensis]|uniref:SMP-30/Gluconolactonase/LRE-like region domain-containing protein n=1 Tax=Gloeobacter morelensis MG652769 TaxID=2781736 RepID=A0ABY3PSB6_9CYAN|nr:hypothetical protein [Gloeobacter morelensis]UFP96632.1 hypothetical protein ISF26_10660 [Gloeobacter morelensis MG652769]